MSIETSSVAVINPLVGTVMGVVIVTPDFIGILKFIIHSNQCVGLKFEDAADGAPL